MQPNFHIFTSSPDSIGDAGSRFAISGQHPVQHGKRAQTALSHGYFAPINRHAMVKPKQN